MTNKEFPPEQDSSELLPPWRSDPAVIASQEAFMAGVANENPHDRNLDQPEGDQLDQQFEGEVDNDEKK